MKIDFPTLMDIQNEIDPALHVEVFTKTANDLVLRSVPKLNTKLKRKWNLVMRENSLNSYVVASAVDGKFSKRGGTVRINNATASRPLIQIVMDGESIPDKRFSFNFDQELKLLQNNKAKSIALAKRVSRLKKKDKGIEKKPRVKILKNRSAKMLNNAFYATMKNSHSGIFRRKGKQIIELRTITLASMFQQLDFDTILAEHYKKNVTKRYDHYLLQELRKRNKR